MNKSDYKAEEKWIYSIQWMVRKVQKRHQIVFNEACG